MPEMADRRAASTYFDGICGDSVGGLDESLAPKPHIRVVVDQLPARFNEGDRRGTGEGQAALAEDGFEQVKKIGGRHDSPCCLIFFHPLRNKFFLLWSETAFIIVFMIRKFVLVHWSNLQAQRP